MSILRREHILYIIRTRALALLALLAIVGCTSDDAALSEPIPEPTPADGKVAVELALCVSPSQLATTRQPASSSQDVTQLFGTYRDIQDLKIIPFSVTPVELASTPTEGSVTGLSKISGYNYFTDNTIELYIGTRGFLCYGRAIPFYVNTANPAASDYFKNGAIVATFPDDNKPNGVEFKLKPIVDDHTDYSNAEKLANYLNNIILNEGWTVSEQFQNIRASFVNTTKDKFTVANDNLIAGSEANVRAKAQALKTLLNSLTALTTEEENNKTAIIAKIDDTAGTYATTGSYPADINLPDGAAALRWTGTGFVVLKESTTATPMSNHSRFAYPAELYYYTNSAIKTATTSKKEIYEPEGTTWPTIISSYGETDNDVVASTTRSVAIKTPLNYGVSCLVTNIKAVAASLKDYDETPVDLIKEGNDVFPLTGIMIGGQFPQRFDFTPKDVKDEQIIYDNQIPAGVTLKYFDPESTETPKPAPTPVYTLVFQSKDEKPIDIVLEFQNNSGKEFTGYEGGIVYPGTKFYLIGQAWPFMEEAEDYKHRVFTQDHKTELTLQIESLKNAYNVIPNLKTAQYSIKVVNVAVKQWSSQGSESRELYNW